MGPESSPLAGEIVRLPGHEFSAERKSALQKIQNLAKIEQIEHATPNLFR